jgi:hypothetical protein
MEQQNKKQTNKTIKIVEHKLNKLQKSIQKNERFLEVSSSKTAELLVKSCRGVSKLLFALGLPFAFFNNWFSAIIAFGSSLAAYVFYELGSMLIERGGKHQQNCVKKVEALKKEYTQTKVALYELCNKLENAEGIIVKDEALQEEIKQNLTQKQNTSKEEVSIKPLQNQIAQTPEI